MSPPSAARRLTIVSTHDEGDRDRSPLHRTAGGLVVRGRSRRLRAFHASNVRGLARGARPGTTTGAPQHPVVSDARTGGSRVLRRDLGTRCPPRADGRLPLGLPSRGGRRGHCRAPPTPRLGRPVHCRCGRPSPVYLVGVPWLAFQLDLGPAAAVTAGIVPFVWIDLIKAVAAALTARTLVNLPLGLPGVSSPDR